ncbi:MAG: glycosyl transferase [Bacteroidales bacterium]|nr:glycosyl transferase [Bacteroidales bacterium]
MIPKLIHYCWLSGDPIPDNLQIYMRSWKEKLPDYKFILWNFDRFDKASSKWVAQAFDNKKYAFAADYIRLYAVYHFGGFYLDMDIEVLKSFDDLLHNPLVLAYEDDTSAGIEAGVFGAEKHHPIIKDCLDYYNGRNFIKEDGTFETMVLPKIMLKYCKNVPDIKDWLFFTCKSHRTRVITHNNKSYTIHHFAGSWCSKEHQQRCKFAEETIAKIGKNLLSSFIIKLYNLYSHIQEKGIRNTISFYRKKESS